MLDGGMTVLDIMNEVLSDFDAVITAETNAEYKCDCTRERVEQALAGIDNNEILKMIKEDGGAEISCHFCDKVYYFDVNELRVLT